MGRIKRPDADSTILQCTLTGPYTTLARVSFLNDLCDAALRGAGLFALSLNAGGGADGRVSANYGWCR